MCRLHSRYAPGRTWKYLLLLLLLLLLLALLRLILLTVGTTQPAADELKAAVTERIAWVAHTSSIVSGARMMSSIRPLCLPLPALTGSHTGPDRVSLGQPGMARPGQARQRPGHRQAPGPVRCCIIHARLLPAHYSAMPAH